MINKENSQLKWTFQNISYGNDENQKFDIIIPGGRIVHAVIYIHGGAYLFGNKSQYPSFLADYSKNNIFATIDYRLLNKDNDIQMEDILSDVHDVLTEIIELARAHNVTIRDFILVGHSAGGHIGLLYGYKYFEKSKNIKIVTCISLAGPTDFTDDSGWSSMTMWGENIESRLLFLSRVGTKLTGHTINLTQCNWTQQKDYPIFKNYIMDISPIQYIHDRKGNVPPTLLVHARGDNQVPYNNALRLITALDYTFVPHKLITPIGNANNHMLGGKVYTTTEPTLYKDQAWVVEARNWIETYLR